MGNGYPVVPTDALDALRADLQKMSDRIKELERPTGTQDASLLATYRANQISPAVGSGANAGFLVTTTIATFITVDIVVPTGYTRALVIANSSASIGPGAAFDRLYSSIVIAGNTGGEIFGFVDDSIGGGSSASHAVTLTGLTAGSNVTSLLKLRTLIGNSGTGAGTKAVLTASALFLT